MSLSYRFGAVPMLAQVLSGLFPRLPAITIRIGHIHGEHKCDGRLEELREQIETNGGESPFMIDNGTILKAAPKKRMSHRRHRTKLYAPGDKQIKQLNNLVRCPACGSFKRSHFMCMHCFAEIKAFLKGMKRDNGLIKDTPNPQTDLDPVDERLLYPGKFVLQDERKLKEKEWIKKREEPLMFNPLQKTHSKR